MLRELFVAAPIRARRRIRSVRVRRRARRRRSQKPRKVVEVRCGDLEEPLSFGRILPEEEPEKVQGQSLLSREKPGAARLSAERGVPRKSGEEGGRALGDGPVPALIGRRGRCRAEIAPAVLCRRFLSPTVEDLRHGAGAAFRQRGS